MAAAARLIGVRLNLFQVADIISLIPGVTRRLKPLSAAKADQPLVTSYISSSRSGSLARSLNINSGMCTLVRTQCSELQREDKAFMEQVYFWALNGLAPICYRRSSSG